MQITPEYTWNQDGGKIEVNAQFKAIDSSLVKSTRNYTITGIFFCFNAPPYLFQLDFEQEIDPFRIKIVLKEEGNVQFVFPKKDPRIIWDRLLTTKSKEERLMARMASVDRLRAKQQVLQVRRQKNKKIRYKAAQQRQWDEEKCLKKIINKLESDEKQQYTKKLKQWVVKMDNTKKKESTKKMDDTKSSDETKESSDDSSSTSNTSNNFNHYVNPFSTPKPVPTIIENIDKMGEGREGRKKPPYSPPKFAKPPRFIESKEFKEECSEPETNDIRQSNVVEVGFTEWDYVTPVREHSKPPEFALKSNVQSLDKSKSANGANGLNGGSHNESSRSARTKLEETSHICLCDKGIKFFENGDYQSAINAFTASIRRCPQFLQSYISRFQCYIELILATSDDLQYDERYISKDILQMQRIAQRYHGLGSMIIALQKGIIMTPILLDELRKSVDPTGLQDKIKDIRHSLKSPLKTCKYDPKNPMNARNWPGSKKMGIFRNPKTLSGLYDLALKCTFIRSRSKRQHPLSSEPKVFSFSS